ncbi:hypothetical protein M427DRAFT_355230 [Gonapodya prolifera JEL478]|uniref:Uncharacterized protein n=1 Tax=Gonapodya prolifera (strain JEL478) TaxID=1344416 RepID=A0A139AC31_GONPJ|nr:hypothetical protein M427DRAFT_355230 [Gonapodya prolifera JEL478]|eukprot:KXS14154.1 hypothetical protein M427DRAFT_355230 [Gonapodya prolifera JEL478]
MSKTRRLNSIIRRGESLFQSRDSCRSVKHGRCSSWNKFSRYSGTKLLQFRKDSLWIRGRFMAAVTVQLVIRLPSKLISTIPVDTQALAIPRSPFIDGAIHRAICPRHPVYSASVRPGEKVGEVQACPDIGKRTIERKERDVEESRATARTVRRHDISFATSSGMSESCIFGKSAPQNSAFLDNDCSKRDHIGEQ